MINGKIDAVSNNLPLKTDSLTAKENPSVRLYPNPAKNKAEIEIKGFDAGHIKIQLINNEGKLLREEKRLVHTGTRLSYSCSQKILGFIFYF